MARPEVVIHQNMKAFDYGFCLLEAWERLGVHVLNTTRAGHPNLNKWSQQQLFAEAQVPHPHTGLVLTPEHLYHFARRHGYPFVVKPALSSGGFGVVPIGQARHVLERIEPLMDGKTSFIAQHFVTFMGADDTHTVDRKAVVVGGQVVTVMERTGVEGHVAASRCGEEMNVPLKVLLPEEVKFVTAAAAAVHI